MADFVAVIRKAVDGLANNTPENRAKVYDKARSAVVRQLENMKPRPPEEMLQRQIMKLDTAIAEVEGEYSEALPALDDEDEGVGAAYAAPVPEDVSSPYYEESVAQQQRYADDHEAEAEPAHPDHQDEPEQHDTYAAHQDVDRHEEREPAYQAEPAEETAYHAEHAEEPRYRAEEPAEEAELYERHSSHETTETHSEPESYQYEAPASVYEQEDEQHAVEPRQEAVAEEDHAHRNWVGQDSHVEPAPWEREEASVEEQSPDDQLHAAYRPEDVAHDDYRQEHTHQQEYAHEEPREHEPFSTETVLHENAPLPYTAGFDGQSNYYGNVNVEPEHHPAADETPYAAFDEHDADRAQPETAQTAAAGKAAAPVDDFSSYFQDTALDLPPKSSPSLPRADEDPFAAGSKKDDKERTPWDDLEELIGYDGGANDRSDKTTGNNFDSGFTGAGIPAAAYATKKKPKRNYAGMVLGLGILVLLAGGGYAAWTNRDALNDMVGGLVNSAKTGTSTETPAGETSQTASAPANGGTTPATTQPVASGQTPAQGQASTGTPAATRPADDGSVTGTKFTQRLLADGTEKDEGPGPGANGQPVTAEGQSVYQQNEAPSAQNTAPAAPAASGSQPAAQQAATPAAAATGDRMFLYEEVLGQTVPTAIEGTVSWSLQNEKDEAGKPSPEVQGQITIPGRGLSALITFKRNTDPSLPASHLVEIVFSVSPGFEGGAIDSVQRIAMKSTEQDRGNALIAVPAKITDDFHMIALNDFPDARKTNLELLRTRDWIDIPVSYRNGRRALLTLQKGTDGKAAFETALREWMAASPTTGQ